MTRILLEGHNLTLASATGIGTYARTLANTARTIGFATDVLISSHAKYDRKDPQFSEISFFDPLPRKSHHSPFVPHGCRLRFSASLSAFARQNSSALVP